MDHDLTLPARRLRYPGFGILALVWTFLGVLGYARYARHAVEAAPSSESALVDLFSWLACYYPWLFLTPLLFRLERKFPLTGKRWRRHALFLAVAGLPLSYLAYAIGNVLDAIVRYAFHRVPLITDAWWPMPARDLFGEQTLFWLTVGASCVIRNLLELRKKEHQATQLVLEKSRLESALRQAQLETLRMRLNPHFLFNCLQSISTLSQQNPRVASKMLARLGDLLRSALQRDTEAEITLEREIAIAKAYVSIEQMRFGDRLSVQFDIQSGTEQALVPSFLFQPLVENAIEHGLRGEQTKGVINIQSVCEANELVLIVSDNGTGITAEQLDRLQMGIGLGSTCERLAQMYPGQHTFSIRRLPERGTEVRIAFPTKFRDATFQKLNHEQTSSVDR